MRRIVWLAALWLCGSGVASAAEMAERSLKLDGLAVTAWFDETGPLAGRPVVVFSHGFHGCATQSRFLTEALAAAGYLVLAPNHKDAVCNGSSARWRDRPDVPFRDAEAWDDTRYRDRADDIRRLIAAARADPEWRQADWSRLGLAGHSLGGYAVLGLAGAWPAWRMEGVAAVLALSPYSQPFAVRRTLAGLAAPVMYQGGTRDLGITPGLKVEGGAYDQSPAPKYFVELDRAGHFEWTDIRRGAHAAIVAYAVAFMNRHVRGMADDGTLAAAGKGVAAYRFAVPDGRQQALEAPRPSVRERVRQRLGM
jgi:predicted dienelactone hydrolase